MIRGSGCPGVGSVVGIQGWLGRGRWGLGVGG